MNINRRLERIEQQIGAPPAYLCQCSIDPHETWETCPPEVLAHEWASNTCLKCDRAKMTDTDHDQWALHLARAYGTEEDVRQLEAAFACASKRD